MLDATSAGYALSSRERLYLELMGVAIKGSLGFEPLHAATCQDGSVIIDPDDHFWSLATLSELVQALQHLSYHCHLEVSLTHEGFRLEMPSVQASEGVHE